MVRKAFVPEHTLHWTGLVSLRSAFDSSLLTDFDVPPDAAHWVGRTLFISRAVTDEATRLGQIAPFSIHISVCNDGDVRSTRADCLQERVSSPSWADTTPTQLTPMLPTTMPNGRESAI